MNLEDSDAPPETPLYPRTSSIRTPASAPAIISESLAQASSTHHPHSKESPRESSGASNPIDTFNEPRNRYIQGTRGRGWRARGAAARMSWLGLWRRGICVPRGGRRRGGGSRLGIDRPRGAPARCAPRLSGPASSGGGGGSGQSGRSSGRAHGEQQERASRGPPPPPGLQRPSSLPSRAAVSATEPRCVRGG